MKLEVKSVRYFDTRRGVGYECKTNIDNVQIWNDGEGGGTYVTGDPKIIRQLENLYESHLEKLINNYESK